MTKPTKTSAAMQKPDIERRAAELHEGCRMPMEQARELAASEANPDWYARGQDWGLADALTNGQSGDWTLDDIARAFAAGAKAKTTMKVLMSMDPELLRRVVQAETEVELLRAALPVVLDASAIPIAWASSVGWRANQLMSAEQYRQCLPKNRADFDVPLYGPEALDNYRRQADENQQDAARFRMLLQQHKHWLGIFRCDPDGAPSDSLDHVELRALLDQLIAQERSA
jgi:hypothetical protein